MDSYSLLVLECRGAVDIEDDSYEPYVQSQRKRLHREKSKTLSESQLGSSFHRIVWASPGRLPRRSLVISKICV